MCKYCYSNKGAIYAKGLLEDPRSRFPFLLLYGFVSYFECK